MQKNLTKLTYRAFSVFIALVLQSQSTVANVKSSGLQIAQQPQPTATQANNPRDWRNIPGLLDEDKEFDAKGTPAAKATVQQADSRDKQLNEEAKKFAQQKTPEAYRQAILKHQERLKIWQQPEIKQAIPKIAHFREGLAYSEIGYNYFFLKEYQLSRLKDQFSTPINLTAILQLTVISQYGSFEQQHPHVETRFIASERPIFNAN